MLAKRTMHLLLGLVLVTSGGITACGSSKTSHSSAPTSNVGGTGGTQTPKRGGQLHLIATENMITDWTPDNFSDWAQENQAWTVYGYLVTLNGNQVVPDLASSYDYNAAARTLTFHLRPNLRFSDGTPLTSADVAFSAAQWKKGPNWGTLVSSITSVDDSNPQVAVFHMSTPDAYLSTVLSAQNFAILKNNFGGMTTKAYYAHPISAGPFMVQSQNATGTSLVLVRNPYYWDQPRPYLDGMTWTYVADPSQQLLQLTSGAGDLVFPPLPFDDVRTLPANEVAYAPNSVLNEILQINVRKSPMNDPNFREAITLGINRALIAQGLWGGKATPPKSAIGDNLPDSVTPTGGDWSTFNLQQARADLGRSSYKSGTPVAIMVASDQSNDVTLAEALTQELQAVGINAVVQKLDFQTMLSRWSAGNFQISLHFSGNDFPSEGTNVAYAQTPGLGFYFTGAPTTVAVNQWAQYQLATSLAGQIAAVQPVEDYIYANKLVIPVVDIPAPYGVSPKAHIPFTGYLMFNPSEAWLSS